MVIGGDAVCGKYALITPPRNLIVHAHGFFREKSRDFGGDNERMDAVK
jgi:hypothetical protein